MFPRTTRASTRKEAAVAAAASAAASAATSSAVTKATAGPSKAKGKAVVRSKSTKRKRASANDDDDADGDNDGNDGNDDNDGGGQSSRSKKKGKKVQDTSCDFCKNDPVGIQMAKQRACDWEEKWKGCYVECSNCADHRSQNPNQPHECKPPRVKHIWRKYGVADPNTYNPPACDRCVQQGRTRTCNADPILKYSCFECKKGPCIVNGEQMEKRLNLRLKFANWMRHECQPCRNQSGKFKRRDFPGCSFLRDRSTWNQPCERCRVGGMACFNSGFLVWAPPPTIPASWHVDLNFYNNNWADVRGDTPWRQNCKRCREDGHRCRISLKALHYACARCSQLGIDCVDDVTNVFRPLFTLARVGFGRSMPFQECNRCAMMGRNCDHQRPCDSCVQNNEEGLCDLWVKNSNRNHNCFNGRIEPNPGPLYYLALGYGAGGVDDRKDGSRIEHWIGPITNIYQMKLDKQRPMGITEAGHRSRGFLRPPGEPPHADQNQGGNLVNQPPSGLPAQTIVATIQGMWPQAQAINQQPLYQQTLTYVRDRIQELEQEENDVPDNSFEDGNGVEENNVGDGGGGDENQGDMYQDVDDGNDFDFALTPQDIMAARNQIAMDQAANNPFWGVANILAAAVNPYQDPGQSSTAGLFIWAAPITFDDSAPRSQAEMEADVDHMDIDPALMPDGSLPLVQAQTQVSQYTQFNPPNPGMMQMPYMPFAQPGPSSGGGMIDLVLFGLVRGQDVPGVPFNNVLGAIPEQIDGTVFSSNLLQCTEIPYHSNASCNNIIHESSVCKCPTHGGNPVAVCDTCSQGNAEALANPYSPILVNNQELLNMRAYLCHECTDEVSNDPLALNRRRKAGVYNVWGRIAGDPGQYLGPVNFSNGTINFRGDALPGTGCSCATKLFAQRMCGFHRGDYANYVLQQSRQMREWRLRQFNRAICPGCIVNKSAEEANLSADDGGFGPKAWACLACGDWVINQPSVPKLVPGWQQWFVNEPDWM